MAWTDNTVDNETLGRKSSKICCIYHKPKDYDESSSEDSSSASDSDDTGDEHDSAAHRDLKRKERRSQGDEAPKQPSFSDQDESGPHASQKKQGSSGASSQSSLVQNAYEKGLK